MKNARARKMPTMTMLRRSSRHAARATPAAKPRTSRTAPIATPGMGPGRGQFLLPQAPAVGGRRPASRTDQGPRVVAVDRQVRISRGGLLHLAEEGKEVQRERRDEYEQDGQRSDGR